MRSFYVYGANTVLYRFICVINAVFNSFDTVYLVFIAATGSNHTGFADSCIFTSCINIQPINAHTVIVHNGDLKRLVRYALHRAFAVALVARTSHAGFINEFAGTITLAASNNICFHSHSPFFLGGSNAARLHYTSFACNSSHVCWASSAIACGVSFTNIAKRKVKNWLFVSCHSSAVISGFSSNFIFRSRSVISCQKEC